MMRRGRGAMGMAQAGIRHPGVIGVVL